MLPIILKIGPVTIYSFGLFLAIAILGFGDATYLTVEHFTGGIPPCSVINGCEKVLTSPYATIGPAPIALVGALYYLVLIVLVVLYMDTHGDLWLRTATWIATIGFAISLVLIFLQVSVLHAICLYCMGSAASTTLLFLLGFPVRKRA